MFLKTECFISNDLVNKLSILILFLVGHFKTRYTGGVVVILFRNTPLPPRNFSFYFITLAWLGNFIRQKNKAPQIFVRSMLFLWQWHPWKFHTIFSSINLIPPPAHAMGSPPTSFCICLFVFWNWSANWP